MNPVFIIIKNLLLTVLIEGALVLVFTKSSKTVYHSVLVNMLTNPLVNLVLISWGSFVSLPIVPFYYIVTAILEIAAVITEWLLYYKWEISALKRRFLPLWGLMPQVFLLDY